MYVYALFYMYFQIWIMTGLGYSFIFSKYTFSVILYNDRKIISVGWSIIDFTSACLLYLCWILTDFIAFYGGFEVFLYQKYGFVLTI